MYGRVNRNYAGCRLFLDNKSLKLCRPCVLLLDFNGGGKYFTTLLNLERLLS